MARSSDERGDAGGVPPARSYPRLEHHQIRRVSPSGEYYRPVCGDVDAVVSGWHPCPECLAGVRWNSQRVEHQHRGYVDDDVVANCVHPCLQRFH